MLETVAVAMRLELLEAIFEGARRLYPRETILLLRGKKRKDVIFVEELVVPPLATYGNGFANIPLHMLPIDFSIVGTVHSHPSSNLEPSNVDFNHFFGQLLLIVGYPFASAENIAVYNSKGKRLHLRLLKRQNQTENRSKADNKNQKCTNSDATSQKSKTNHELH